MPMHDAAGVSRHYETGGIRLVMGICEAR